MSRGMHPKQLLPFAGPQSLLKEALLDVENAFRYLPLIVICNEDHRFLVAEQLAEAGVAPEAILVEPVGRSMRRPLRRLRSSSAAEDQVRLFSCFRLTIA